MLEKISNGMFWNMSTNMTNIDQHIQDIGYKTYISSIFFKNKVQYYKGFAKFGKNILTNFTYVQRNLKENQ